MFPKIKIQSPLVWIIVIVVIGSITTIIAYKSELVNTCTIRQLDIAAGVKNYDASKNAELCDSLNNKIYQFNNDCKSDLEELDCG